MYQIKTNLQGLLDALSGSLYQNPEVFIRELLQNAVDALQMQQSLSVRDKNLNGSLQAQYRIDVILDPALGLMTIQDNGCGMSEDELHDYLSCIASSSKKNREELAGQFGIGLLSAFVVADNIKIQTRKYQAPYGFLWSSQCNDEYDVVQIDVRQPGTSVILSLKPEMRYLLDEDIMADKIQNVANFVPYAIYINGQHRPVNQMHAPWLNYGGLDGPGRELCLDYLEARFRCLILDVLPLNIVTPSGRASGCLFFSKQSFLNEPQQDSRMSIYCKSLFVADNVGGLLPSWARFVGGVIDSPCFEPNLARDQIRLDTTFCAELSEELGKCIIQYLQFLHKNEPSRMGLLMREMSTTMKLLAMEEVNRDFTRQIAPMFTFDTNKGELCFSEICQHAESEGQTTIYKVTEQKLLKECFDQAQDRKILSLDLTWDVNEALFRKLIKITRSGLSLIEQNPDSGDEVQFLRLSAHEEFMNSALTRVIGIIVSEYSGRQINAKVCRFSDALYPCALQRIKDEVGQMTIQSLLAPGVSLDLLRVNHERRQGEALSAVLYVNVEHSQIIKLKKMLDEQIGDVPAPEFVLYVTALYFFARNQQFELLSVRERKWLNLYLLSQIEKSAEA